MTEENVLLSAAHEIGWAMGALGSGEGMLVRDSPIPGYVWLATSEGIEALIEPVDGVPSTLDWLRGFVVPLPDGRWLAVRWESETVPCDENNTHIGPVGIDAERDAVVNALVEACR